jgi:hypothetical protein
LKWDTWQKKRPTLIEVSGFRKMSGKSEKVATVDKRK